MTRLLAFVWALAPVEVAATAAPAATPPFRNFRRFVWLIMFPFVVSALRVPPGGPAGAEILTQVEVAGHAVALQFAGEMIGHRCAVGLADTAGDAHVAAGNSAADIAAGE